MLIMVFCHFFSFIHDWLDQHKAKKGQKRPKRPKSVKKVHCSGGFGKDQLFHYIKPIETEEVLR